MPNRLAKETSPYLLQHAHNPVDWWPWCDEAFQLARDTDRPVLLSVGYATCHWCHVMERESFEDAGAAEVLNRIFVCVKVDREERPDVDAVYMAACQLLTGRGGWPMTIVMTPDKRPFFAATYLPRRGNGARTGLLDMAEQVDSYWRADRGMVMDSAEKIVGHMRGALAQRPGLEPDPAWQDTARNQLRESYDQRHGGFGEAPKFPSPHAPIFLLRRHARTGNPEDLDMAVSTLRAMRRGGIWDHLGHGFHRYSTDRHWLLPHFEKMLYDQAMTAMACLEASHAAQAAGERSGADLAATASDIFGYVRRHLTGDHGAFLCAEDADSEGEEGRFYLWTLDELNAVLGPQEGRFWAGAFGFTRQGNAREESTGRPTGRNVIHLGAPMDDLARAADTTHESLARRFEAARQRLLAARDARPRPLLDDKVLADWNGLMIAAMAMGARILDRPGLSRDAARAADFVLDHVADADGLLHCWRRGRAAGPGTADDHAFMAWGLLELYAATFDSRRLEQAMVLQRAMDEKLWDAEDGGYFLAPDTGEGLPARPKEAYDGAVPSANAVALHNLARLWRLTGDPALEKRARTLARAFAGQILAHPSGHLHFLSGLDLLLGPGQEIVVAGRPGADDTRALLAEVGRRHLPWAAVLLRPPEGDAVLDRLVPFAAGCGLVEGRAAAFVCRDQACARPVTDPARLAAMLDGHGLHTGP